MVLCIYGKAEIALMYSKLWSRQNLLAIFGLKFVFNPTALKRDMLPAL